jgi:hypothetical protein
MSTAAGEIYFIGEKDLRTQKLTNYFKVGIVRENHVNLDRDSAKRMLEHQTGNPRELYIESVQKTDLVEHVETLLHKQFAPLGVRGEWMQLTPKQLSDVKSSAKQLAQEAKAIAANLMKIDELSQKKSDETLLKPSKKLQDLHESYLLARAKVKACDEILEKIKAAFAQALIDSGDDDEGEEEASKEVLKNYAKVQERKGRTVIDYDAFAAKYPKLYAKYVSQKISIKQSATFDGVRGLTVDFDEVDPDFAAEINRFEPLYKKVTSGKTPMQNLHLYSLEIRPLQVEAEWEMLKCESALKVACSTHAGIEGILKWSRVEKITESVDKKALLAAYPDKFEEFTSTAAPTQAIIVDPKKGY